MSSPFQKKFCGKTPNPIKNLGDLNKDGKMSNYEQTRQDAIESNSPNNYGSPLEQFNPKTASIMADAASLEMRAKRKGISGERQMQIDQENYGTTLEKLYRGESSKKILGHKPNPQKFGGRDWELHESSALNQNKEKKVKTENWSDNPIPETEKRKHPDYERAMKNIKAFNKKIGTEGSTKFYRDSLETPVIKHKGKNYPLIALVSD